MNDEFIVHFRQSVDKYARPYFSFAINDLYYGCIQQRLFIGQLPYWLVTTYNYDRMFSGTTDFDVMVNYIKDEAAQFIKELLGRRVVVKTDFQLEPEIKTDFQPKLKTVVTPKSEIQNIGASQIDTICNKTEYDSLEICTEKDKSDNTIAVDVLDNTPEKTQPPSQTQTAEITPNIVPLSNDLDSIEQQVSQFIDSIKKYDKDSGIVVYTLPNKGLSDLLQKGVADITLACNTYLRVKPEQARVIERYNSIYPASTLTDIHKVVARLDKNKSELAKYARKLLTAGYGIHLKWLEYNELQVNPVYDLFQVFGEPYMLPETLIVPLADNVILTNVTMQFASVVTIRDSADITNYLRNMFTSYVADVSKQESVKVFNFMPMSKYVSTDNLAMARFDIVLTDFKLFDPFITMLKTNKAGECLMVSKIAD
ncbi:MAG: hypothetical protein LBP59_10730 [Planctomycetaceae bacterium]|jgi:hypothetical protein|nr:hypothetical protein [Planctomycetaceae bacterium]